MLELAKCFEELNEELLSGRRLDFLKKEKKATKHTDQNET
jgi:hypothetical protein